MAMHQMLLEGMVAGYREASLLPGWAIRQLELDTLTNSYDAPLWTLHFELAGSLLTLALVMLRAAAPRGVHLAGCVGLGVALAVSPLVMFVIGHLAAPLLVRGPRSCRLQVAGAVSLLVGLALCSGQVFADLHHILSKLPGRWLTPVVDPLNLQTMFGEVFVFAGVALLPAAQRVLTRPLARWFGKISFSLYLVHFPVLFTLVCALFLRLNAILPYAVAVSVCSLVGGAISLVLAIAFERWIDRPAIRFSRAI